MHPNAKKQKIETEPNVSASFTPMYRSAKGEFYINEPMVVKQQQGVENPTRKTITSKHRIFLSDKRHVVVQRWGTQMYICIRDYYQTEEGGDFKPSMRGVNLPISQWYELANHVGYVERIIGEMTDKGYDMCSTGIAIGSGLGEDQKDNGKLRMPEKVTPDIAETKQDNWLNHLEEGKCECIDLC